MAAISRADVTWEGDLLKGKGVVSAGTSRAFSALPITWASRNEATVGKTSPEELIAAAHAGCFAMALSFGLANAGKPPQTFEDSAAVTFDKVEAGFPKNSRTLTVFRWLQGRASQRFSQALLLAHG